jgi:hypothetical protein
MEHPPEHQPYAAHKQILLDFFSSMIIRKLPNNSQNSKLVLPASVCEINERNASENNFARESQTFG